MDKERGEGFVSEIALLAGEGLLPVAIAEALAARGTLPVVIPIGKPDPGLLPLAESVVPVREISIRNILGQLKASGVKRIVLAGVVPKKWIFGGGKLDRETREWVGSLPARDDHSLLDAIVSLIESQGVEVVPYRLLIPENLAPEGPVAGREPTREELQDVRYGIRVAKEVVRLSFGQSLAVLSGSVLAVEAMEGTDEMIARAGRIGGKGVVVKMMKSDQDERFDRPTVGPGTLVSMAEGGLTCLAVETGRTIILDKARFAEMAALHGIAVTGFVP